MTKYEFDNMEFKKGMQVIMQNKVYDLIGVDFEIGLIGINLNNDWKLSWYNYNVCEIVK